MSLRNGGLRAVALSLTAAFSACAGAATGFHPAPGSANGAPSPTGPSQPAVGSPELLAVRINGVDQEGFAVVFRLEGGGLAASLVSLAAWRIAAPPGPTLRIEGQDHVRLDAIPSLRWRVDASDQVLIIDVGAASFRRNEIEVATRPTLATLPTALGAYLNYDATVQTDMPVGAPRVTTAATFLDGGASTSFGSLRASGLAKGGRGAGFTRLDTSWIVDRPEGPSSIVVGDAVGALGQWGRAVRFGGVRWATDFSIRPGFVSFPLPGVRGEAAVPSVVDLYVNNAHQLQGNVPPGPFDLPDVPVVTGQGQIRMVVRDLLGREQVVIQPYYVTPALLKSGLHDFSLEAGVVRENYGIDSFRYGRALAVGTERAGITDTVTREFRLELLRSQQTAGAGLIWLVDNFATVNGALAASRSDSGRGAMAAGGAEHQSNGWSASMQGRYTTRDFQQVGQSFAQIAPPRLSMNASVAAGAGSGGVGANLLVQNDWQNGRYRTASLNYASKVPLVGYFNIYASRTRGSTSGYAVGLTFTQLFGSDTSASQTFFRSADRPQDDAASASASRQAALQLQSSAPSGPGFGYRALVEGGDSRRINGEAVWQTDTAAWTAGAARQNRAESYRAGVAGGFAFMSQGVYAARRIEGSYAVVEVGDYPNVRITRDNQVVARTDDKGRAFVGGLRGYESNRIGIEPTDLPLDAEVDSFDVSIAPAARAGVSVTIPVRHVRSAVMRIVDSSGIDLPPGSVVRAGSGSRDFPVGFDGRLFLVGIEKSDGYVASWPSGTCRFQVPWRDVQDDVPDLGVVTCH